MKNRGRQIFTNKVIANIVVVLLGVLLFMALSNLTQVRQTITWFISIFTPFVAGLVIAYLINMPMSFFEKKVLHKFKKRRMLSILISYLLALLLAGLLVGLIMPQIFDSIRTLMRNSYSYLENINRLVTQIGSAYEVDEESIQTFLFSYNDLVRKLVLMLRNAVPNLINIGMQVGSGLVGALTAVIASIYMLNGKEKLMRQTRRLLYSTFSHRNADEILRISRLANNVFSGFISGKIIDSAIIGAICFVFMALMNIISSLSGINAMRMPYALLISVVIGVTNIIPFFGPFIGAIPCAMILLMANPWSAFWFIIFIIVLQQFDGNILGPKILGQTTGLPAMWVLVAIIVGGGLFGFAGMLMGVPTAAVLYTLVSDIVEHRLQKRGLASEPGLTGKPPVSDKTPPTQAKADEHSG